MRSGGRRAPRIALIPIVIKYQDFFLYSSPNDGNRWSHVSPETVVMKVMILRGSPAKFFLLSQQARLWKYHFHITLYNLDGNGIFFVRLLESVE